MSDEQEFATGGVLSPDWRMPESDGCILPRFATGGMAINGLMAYVGTWKGVELREVLWPADWTFDLGVHGATAQAATTDDNAGG